MTKSIIKLVGVLALGAALSAPLMADPFAFKVTIDTTGLVGAANAPFALDLQLNKGDGSLDNTVTLSNFSFTGGSALGGGTANGNASGSLSGTVALADSAGSPFNEYYEYFDADTTSISFTATVSQNSPGATPDGFVMALYDSTSSGWVLSSSSDTLSFLTLGISDANTLGDIMTYSSTDPVGVTVGVSAVPEPATTAAWMGGLGLAAVAFARFWRRRSAQALALV